MRQQLSVSQALLEAEQYPSEWPGVFPSTTGLVFFGTPFRGAGGMNQMEMLEAARREYDNDQVQPTALEVLQPGNAYLQEVVDGFLKKMRGQTNKMQIACFYELRASDVGKIVGGQSRTASVSKCYMTCEANYMHRGLWSARALAVSTYQTRPASTHSREPTST
jgi:hypothetical protein